ncbi:hypothetical protein KDN34_09605 [Shewanella yunxiaonensis]|uniref:Uncharacterized protein n=1 Tax=Shewanella yunxiaonensis TaxID=2829809 RepID=A0ABX7YP49_9GAMM|nr:MULTISPECIES: hypothetical protein [Shewanella]MDF0535308.1 hypothetical protein [Shewanella sp. A32]QUN04530.1 hypothetical protein KDN34_09605 [Shewanella yunxiaonensis]
MSIQSVSLNNTPDLSQAVASNRPVSQPREKIVNPAASSSAIETSAVDIDHDLVDAKYQAKVEYEQDTSASSSAISTYLLTQYAEQRDSIAQMVGVDVYA